ncbi:MAG: integrase core domain-containing protein [Planctomycetales bacterium]|nr:integrase core domain-containing protein [Planctomycetales bacterium]
MHQSRHQEAHQLFSIRRKAHRQQSPSRRAIQAFVERVIQTLKHEVLNAFCVVSEKHLDHILKVSADWYNHRRGHSVRDHLPPAREDESPPTVDLDKHLIICHAELGGYLKSYHAAA